MKTFFVCVPLLMLGACNSTFLAIDVGFKVASLIDSAVTYSEEEASRNEIRRKFEEERIYCLDIEHNIPYSFQNNTCPAGDKKITVDEYSNIINRNIVTSRENSRLTATINCYDKSLEILYEKKANQSCVAGDSEVSEQFASSFRSKQQQDISKITDEKIYCRNEKQTLYFSLSPGSQCPSKHYQVSKTEFKNHYANKNLKTEQTIIAEKQPIESPKPLAKYRIEPIDKSLKINSFGTGFVINSEGFIATNFHVVDGCKQVLVIVGSKAFPSTVVALDKARDLAILYTNYRTPKHAVFKDSQLELGENIFVLGYPLLDRLKALNFTNGVVSMETAMHYNHLIGITAAIQPGNSGGPVIDNSGAVAGIVVAKLKSKDAQNVNFAIKSSALSQLAAANDVKLVRAGFSKKLEPQVIAKEGRQWTWPVFCKGN